MLKHFDKPNYKSEKYITFVHFIAKIYILYINILCYNDYNRTHTYWEPELPSNHLNVYLAMQITPRVGSHTPQQTASLFSTKMKLQYTYIRKEEPG